MVIRDIVRCTSADIPVKFNGQIWLNVGPKLTRCVVEGQRLGFRLPLLRLVLWIVG